MSVAALFTCYGARLTTSLASLEAATTDIAGLQHNNTNYANWQFDAFDETTTTELVEILQLHIDSLATAFNELVLIRDSLRSLMVHDEASAANITAIGELLNNPVNPNLDISQRLLAANAVRSSLILKLTQGRTRARALDRNARALMPPRHR